MRGKFCEKADSHITLLEGVTFVMLLRHLASSISVANVEQGWSVLSTAKNRPRRIFVGLDSQGALLAFAKGRSSSFRLNRSCRKGTAVSLFSGISVFFFWIPSETMPMDGPSRRFQPKYSQSNFASDQSRAGRS